MKRLFLATAFAAVCSVSAANAVEWTNWVAPGVVDPVNGSATGTLGSITVTYTGENEGVNQYASNWQYASTWDNIPPPANSGIQLWGGNGSVVDTITFSQAVVNPILAIVSLGQGGIKAAFDFSTSSFYLNQGGLSTAWGGQGLTRTGNIVYGKEGNGLVYFVGSYTSISWTNPVNEVYYAATVGTVPEISTWAMMLLGFGGLGFLGYRKSRKAASVAA